MKTSEILRKAGDVSRERGWCQGMFEDDDGRVCAWGAIRSANDWGWSDGTVEMLELVTASVPKWNDAPGRTHAEVLIALDAAYVLSLQEEGIEPADLAERGEL